MNQPILIKDGKLLPVMEQFFSLQGEGFHTGEAAWFIRIGGCDVGCAWCDVKESWDTSLFPPTDTDEVVEKALQCKAQAVIVTGGEPLLYNLDYLCEQIKAQDSRFKVQDKSSSLDPRPSSLIKTFLETSGSQSLSGTWDWICLSPKRGWHPREEFYGISHELKMIIHEADDFQWAEEQASKMNANAHLFLQPEWSHREAMLPAIIRYIETHPQWKLSLQMHKYIGIP
ncbi:MAG: 7-carboxy-7-deazaguanine synthase QueE [Bacteroidales bacterium]|nr:7-carboxy-7-deazaguanine synthase QueE [Bacteroidota bacterium]MBL6950315.1 7-carboxy-7-deazaguanine synthase QueE [Bacteroidales bacterium]